MPTPPGTPQHDGRSAFDSPEHSPQPSAVPSAEPAPAPKQVPEPAPAVETKQELEPASAAAAVTPATPLRSASPAEPVGELVSADVAALIARRKAAMQKGRRRGGMGAATPMASSARAASVRSARSRRAGSGPAARTPAQRDDLIKRRQEALARARQRADDEAQTPAHSNRHAAAALTPSQKALIERRKKVQQGARGAGASSTTAASERHARHARSRRAASTRHRLPPTAPTPRSLLTAEESKRLQRGKTPRQAGATSTRAKFSSLRREGNGRAAARTPVGGARP